MRPNYNSDGDAYKENSDPDNNILKGDDAVTPHPHVRQKNEYVAYIIKSVIMKENWIQADRIKMLQLDIERYKMKQEIQ